MLYINSLKSLTPKAAEIASVDIIREIKRSTPYPLSEDRLKGRFFGYFMTKDDLDAMSLGLSRIKPSIMMVQEISRSEDPSYEPINVKRAESMLSELPSPLERNISFIKDIMQSQDSLVKEMLVLNSIPKLRTDQEKRACNDALNRILGRILRGGDMAFNYHDIIHEGHVERISALMDSTANGFLFRFTSDEILRRARFDDIKGRLPRKEIDVAEAMLKEYQTIRLGIKRAYDCNMRLIDWAVVLYSYIRWLSSGK